MITLREIHSNNKRKLSHLIEKIANKRNRFLPIYKMRNKHLSIARNKMKMKKISACNK
jgi:hypothetical protein